MVLKQDTFNSETGSTENHIVGCSLKKGKLKNWIYENGYNKWNVARRMSLTAERFDEMLTKHEFFNERQMKRLIDLMGAEDAFKVIYFSTPEERKRVQYEVFEKYKRKEDYD